MHSGLGLDLRMLLALAALSPAGSSLLAASAAAQAPGGLPVPGALLASGGQRAAWPLEDGSGVAVAERQGEGTWSPPRRVTMRGVARAGVLARWPLSRVREPAGRLSHRCRPRI